MEIENFPFPPRNPNGIAITTIRMSAVKIFFDVIIPLILGSRHFIKHLLRIRKLMASPLSPIYLEFVAGSCTPFVRPPRFLHHPRKRQIVPPFLLTCGHGKDGSGVLEWQGNVGRPWSCECAPYSPS